jgi:hypothetical protein
MTGQAGIAKEFPFGQILDGTPPDLSVFQARATSAQMAKNMIKVHKDTPKMENTNTHSINSI